MNELMLYFNANGVIDLWLLLMNGCVATAIFGLLLFPRQWPDRVPLLSARLTRYAFVAAYSVLAARVWLGLYYTPVEPTEVIVNVLILWLAWVTRGDISVLFDAVRLVLDRRARF